MAILEMSFRNVEKTAAVEELIKEKVAKLERVYEELVSCRISVERPQQHQRMGNPYRIRISMGIRGKELVTTRESTEGDMHDLLPTVLRDTFRAAQRQLKAHSERRKAKRKLHPQQEVMAVVTRLFREEGYGFLSSLDGREIYFHRNSVLHDDFDRLHVGTGVRFSEEMGEEGPQASSVQIVDKPGVRQE
jgi:cold shock CspA family protein